LRVDSTGPANTLSRLHLDGFVFTPDESYDPGLGVTPSAGSFRLDAADPQAFVDGNSQTMEFSRFLVSTTAEKNLIPLRAEEIARVLRWRDESQLEAFTFSQWGWYSTVTPITEITQADAADPQRFLLTTSGAESKITAIYGGNRVYVFNALSELDEPGEWYLDYRSGVLSYRPRAGEDLNNAEIVVPTLERIIEVSAPAAGAERVEYVAFRGLTFAHADLTREHTETRATTDCAVLLENAWHCAVEDCVFDNVGGYGARLSLDCVLNRVVGNTITRSGAGGIFLNSHIVGWGTTQFVPGEQNEFFSPVGNLIARNDIHDCGEYKKYVAGIHWDTRPENQTLAPGNVFRRNLIYALPRNGIFGFRNLGGFVFEYNHIYEVLRESDDGGLIHVCATADSIAYATSPAIVRGNLLHDAEAFRNDDYIVGNVGLNAAGNGHGVYLDNHTSHVLIENNVIRNTRKGAIFFHMGRDNTVRNNIVLDDRYAQIWFAKYWSNTIENNIFAWTTPTPYLLQFSGVEAPQVGDLTFNHNVYWHGGEDFEFKEIGGWENWRALGADADSVVADPLIDRLDLTNRVLTLKPESPAFKLGFKAIDLSLVGPQAAGRD
jgi:parallel beta-helix repeat protein